MFSDQNVRTVVFETFESNTALLRVSNGLLSSATSVDSVISKNEAVLVLKHYFKTRPLFSEGTYYVSAEAKDGFQIVESVMFFTTDSGDRVFVLRTDEQSDVLKTRIFQYSYPGISMSIIDAISLMEYHRSASSFSLSRD